MKLYISLFLNLVAAAAAVDEATPNMLRGNSNNSDTEANRELEHYAYDNEAQKDPATYWGDKCSQLKQLAVSDDATVWGLSKSDQGKNDVCGPWNDVKQYHPYQYSNIELKQISISGNGNHVWGVNSNDQIYFLYTDPNTQVKSFKRFPNGLLRQVSVTDNGDVWGVNKNNKIYFKSAGAKEWTQIGDDSTMLSQISVSANGAHVWGVNPKGEIYYWYYSNYDETIDPSRFKKFQNGKLKQVEVDNQNNVWGVNEYDKIYFKRDGDESWTQVGSDSTMLNRISASGDGKQVWGVNDNGKIYKWDGTYPFDNRPFHEQIMYRLD